MGQRLDMEGARARSSRIRREHDLEATTLDSMRRRAMTDDHRVRRSFAQRCMRLLGRHGRDPVQATEAGLATAEPIA